MSRSLTRAVKSKTMSQLTVRQQKLSNQIAEAGRRSGLGFAKDAAGFTKIRELKPEVISDGLAAIFVQVTNFLGIKEAVSPNNKQDIRQLIETEFKSLSLEEIQKAFQMDRYGTFGETEKHYQLFNAEYVSKVLSKYKTWLRKTRFDNNLPINESFEVVKDLTQEEKDEIVISGIKRLYDEFKATGVVPTGSKFAYDWLDERGHLNYDKNAKNKFLDRANIALKGQIKDARSKYERKELADMIEQRNSTKAIVMAKRIALKEFFNRNNIHKILSK